MANEYPGWVRTVHLSADESTWGSIPGSPAWRQVPVIGEYGVKLVPASRQQTPMTGRRQRQSNIIYRASLEGSFQPMMCGYVISSKSLMEELISWAFSSPASVDLTSRSISFNDSLEAKEHKGLRVNTATISWSAGNPVTMQLTVAGKDEASGTAQTLSSTVVPMQSEAESQDVVVSLGGSEISVQSGSITINNNLQLDEYVCKSSGNARRDALPAGIRAVDFEFHTYHNATTRDALLRAGGINNTTAQVVIKALHHGSGASGSYATATFDFDVASFMGFSTDHDLNKLVKENPKYVILKPNTTDNDVDITYGLT